MECAWLAGLRFRCFGILRSGLSFVHVRERPTYERGRERGREESSDGRSFREACFLNALIQNREWGREVCELSNAAGKMPSAFAKY